MRIIHFVILLKKLKDKLNNALILLKVKGSMYWLILQRLFLSGWRLGNAYVLPNVRKTTLRWVQSLQHIDHLTLILVNNFCILYHNYRKSVCLKNSHDFVHKLSILSNANNSFMCSLDFIPYTQTYLLQKHMFYSIYNQYIKIFVAKISWNYYK